MCRAEVASRIGGQPHPDQIEETPEMRFTDEEVKQLLRRALDNDEAAWKALFEGLYGLMRSQGVRAGLTGDDLDDSVGDILHSLVATPGEFLEARDTLSYLSASSYFAALRYGRRETDSRRGNPRCMTTPTETMAGPPGNRGAQPQQVKIILSNQVARAVEAAFDAVPDPARRYALLHYRADLSYEEVAARMSVGVPLARSGWRSTGRSRAPSAHSIPRSVRSLTGEVSGMRCASWRCPIKLRPQVTPESRRVIERWVTARESLCRARGSGGGPCRRPGIPAPARPS